VPRTVDSLTAKQAEVTAQQGPGPAIDPVEMAIPEPFAAIPVRDEAPAQGTGRTQGLSAARPVLQLLPQDPRRRRAVVLAVEKPAVVCQSVDLATAANGQPNTGGIEGFYLPVGVPLVLVNKAAWWVTYTSTDAPGAGAVSHVSVLVEKDDE
jgi:hypothetical protein